MTKVDKCEHLKKVVREYLERAENSYDLIHPRGLIKNHLSDEPEICKEYELKEKEIHKKELN